MSTINTVIGKKYRILKDATNKIWDQISFWTDSTDVTFADGMTAEDKVGAIQGLVTTEQTTTGYVMDASVVALAPTLFTGVLRVGGTTTLTFTDSVITDTAKIQIYTDQWGFVPEEVVVSNNTLTIEFPDPEVLTNVRVEVSEFHS